MKVGCDWLGYFITQFPSNEILLVLIHLVVPYFKFIICFRTCLHPGFTLARFSYFSFLLFLYPVYPNPSCPSPQNGPIHLISISRTCLATFLVQLFLCLIHKIAKIANLQTGILECIYLSSVVIFKACIHTYMDLYYLVG